MTTATIIGKNEIIRQTVIDPAMPIFSKILAERSERVDICDDPAGGLIYKLIDNQGQVIASRKVKPTP